MELDEREEGAFKPFQAFTRHGAFKPSEIASRTAAVMMPPLMIRASRTASLVTSVISSEEGGREWCCHDYGDGSTSRHLYVSE